MKQNSSDKIQEKLLAFDPTLKIIKFDASTRTSADAAQAIGCEVRQIAKSIVFRGKSGTPYLVIASGENRIDEKKIRSRVEEKVEKADAAFTLEVTGYAIGGIPPSFHSAPLRTLIDQELLQYDPIWAAAGTPHSVFQLTPAQLLAMSGGEVLDVKKE